MYGWFSLYRNFFGGILCRMVFRKKINLRLRDSPKVVEKFRVLKNF